jgi:uncharacterized protein (DUF1697 family)
MPVYIAMLRGINVTGHNPMKMSELARACEALGCRQVKTYIQSGNVVFTGVQSSPDNLSKKMESKISAEFGFSVTVLTKTLEDLRQVIQHNPFVKEPGIDLSKLHVTFLSGEPTTAGLDKMRAWQAGSDRFRAVGREIYLHCPDGYGRTKLSNNAIEKAVNLRATTRNWNTVNKLHEMALQCAK